MDLGVSYHSLLLVCCCFVLSSASDGRLGRRQLDFDSVNENSDVPVFGRRISSLTKKKQSHLPVSSPDSQSDGTAPDRNYLPGKDYLPPPSAQPPKLTNIINIEPPFGSSDQINNAINYTPEPETTTKAVTKRIKVPIPRVRTTTEGNPNIEPAPAENSPNLIKPVVDKHENHSLERLCNDPFHSFLCTGATKLRERITGRLRPQAKIPANVLNGQASFQNERKSPPARPIEPSPSRDFPAFLKPYTTKPVTTTERPVFKGFDTQPTSDFRAYLPPVKINSKPENNYDTQAASDSRAYLPPTEAPVQPQPSFESREYLPPAKPDSSAIVQQRKQFSTQPKSFKSFAQNQASSNNNFYNFPVSSTLKPIVVSKVNPTVKPFHYTPQYTTQKPPVFPQFNNFGGQDKFPYKSKSDGYAFETPRTTSPTTTILPEPSNLNEFFAKDSKIPQPNDLDSRLYLPPTNAKPSIQPEPSSEDKSFLPPPLPQKPKFPSINPLPAQQLPVRLLPKTTTVRPKLDNIVGAGAQNPIAISQGTTERQHTLEELCNDSFHSFLCVPLKPRQRFNGRLRPQAKLPPGLVLPESSNINEENRLPAPSSTDEQRIKPTYLKPSTTIPQPTPSTTRQPASYLPPIRNNIIPEPSQNELTIIRTTKKPLIHFEPSDAFNPYQAVTKKDPKTITKSYSFSYSHTTTKKYNDDYSPLPSSSDNTARIMNLNDGYSYPKPYQPFTFPTTPTPSTTPEVYPQPSNDQLQAIRPSNNNGYNYPKPSNQFLLPSEDNESPSPSNNFGAVVIPENVKRKPKVKFTLPTTAAPVVTTPEPDTNIEPAAAQNPVVAVQVVKDKEDHHTLEEQCSHAFHSFLCNTPKRKRPRPDGRLYSAYLAKPTPAIQPAPSNNNPETLKPSVTTKAPYKKIETSTKNNDLEEAPAPSSNQQQALPFNGYNYPNPKTPFNSPVKSTTPKYDTAPSNPIENKAPFGYSYPKPSPAFNLPISTTTTSAPVPEFIDETRQSGSFENVGYSYPKPSPSERLPSAAEPSPNILKADESKESTGYSYNVPTKSFTLPTRSPTTTSSPYFDIDVRSASGDSPSLLQPAQNTFGQGYNYPRPDTSKQLQLPSNKLFLNSNSAKTNKPIESKPTPPTSISEQLPKIDEDQFPFSFFKKATTKPKVKDPLPRDSDLIILKL